MNILVYGLSLFVIAFVIHLIVWRIRLPKRQVKTLLQIFFATLIAGIVACRLAPPEWALFSTAPPDELWEYLHIGLLFISLTLAYMITYSALEADSPSLVMVMTINSAAPNGLNKEQFEKLMSDDTLVMPRIRDVLLDKMVSLADDKYCLTRKGAMMARLFIFYRKLINAPEGGG